jgi:diacylglycerol kinase (ATP)
MAGGDGSLMLLVMSAKEAGCDIANLVCCVLPYGTGNDLSRSLNWGGTESELKIYESLPRLIQEICLNVEVKSINIWRVLLKYRQGGDTYFINSLKQYQAMNKTVYERFMISYFSMGEDARVGTGFEKNRTKYRCCNNLTYLTVGLWNAACFCWRPSVVSDQLAYLKALKA